MLTKVTDDIHKLIVRFPKGMGKVNCYLLEGERGYTVIDTGTYSNEAKEIWENTLATGIKIEKVVLTHTHQDHIGMARWFQREIGVPVVVSDFGVKEMQRNLNKQQRMNELVMRHGNPELLRHAHNDSFIFDFEPVEIFSNHQTIRLGNDTFEALWTPGHAPDHFCFYQKEKNIMIVGDHVLEAISPVIGLWSGVEENALADYFKSLDLIKNYPVTIALPGHGETIFHLNKRADEIKKRHEQRLEQVLAIVKGERKTADQVCREIYGDMDSVLRLSQFMACLTRLLYLESVGKAVREEIDGKVMFQVS